MMQVYGIEQVYGDACYFKIISYQTFQYLNCIMDISQAPFVYTNVNVDRVMIHHTLVSLNRGPKNETHSWAL